MLYPSFPCKKIVSLDTLYSLFKPTFAKNFVFSGEVHDFWEILYVRSGEITVSANEQVYVLKKGDIVFHKPMEFHSFYISGKSAASCFIMSFVASGPLMTTFENYVATLSQGQQKQLSSLISFLSHECFLDTGVERRCLHYLNEHPDMFQMVVNRIEQFLLSFPKRPVYIDSNLSTANAIVYQRAVHVMEENISQWLSVPEIAEKCNVSVTYLKEIFIKYTGLGIHKYFLKLKLSHAYQMLKDGQSADEVSKALGFSSPSYFSTVYKRENGVSPTLHKSST